MAAVHEAGHAVIAMHLGVDVLDADVRPTHTHDLYSKKSYVGRATYDRPSNADQHRLIAVAGMVAEHVWKARGPACEHWWDTVSDPACMSDTDWAGTGCEPGEPDDALIEAVETVLPLLAGELQPKLTELSRRLIEADSRQTIEAIMNVKALLGYEVAASSDNARATRAVA
ncbi:hypothetical protein [Bosea sp. (in: a-proteobacteria)]|uniref:hypothetical protein n=1 Tax=Bosea sp. (in: a-proteobacteria) TaxID=1871050 RepID=UPI002FCBAB64